MTSQLTMNMCYKKQAIRILPHLALLSTCKCKGQWPS